MTGIPVTSFKPPPPWVAKSNPGDPWPWPDGLTVLASFTDYAGMLQAFRDRANERKISMSDEDTATIAGLPDKYLAKLLAPRPVRRIGMLSLGPVLGVLGAKLLLVVDEEACRRLESRKDVRLKQRNGNLVRSAATTHVLTRRFMQKIGRIGGKTRWKKQRKRDAVAKAKSDKARKAALIRWSDVKEAAKCK